MPAHVDPTACVESPELLGDDVRVWRFAHVMAGARIGAGSSLGQGTFVGRDVTIGAGCKIQNNVSLYEGVTLEDDVFCGPSCVFTNVDRPRAWFSQKDRFAPTRVKRGATIGANATIRCGVTVGEYAFVAAGAVVVRDVPDHQLVMGTPAVFASWVGRRGEKLRRVDADGSVCFVCPVTEERYEAHGDGLRLVTR